MIDDIRKNTEQNLLIIVFSDMDKSITDERQVLYQQLTDNSQIYYFDLDDYPDEYDSDLRKCIEDYLNKK